MQYILSELEIKDLLLCRKYVEELVSSMQKSIDLNPKLKENETFMKNYEKYKRVVSIPHPFISTNNF